jgi:hypothetical protein
MFTPEILLASYFLSAFFKNLPNVFPNLSSASWIQYFLGNLFYCLLIANLNIFTYFVFSFLLSDVTDVRECFVLQVLGKCLTVSYSS